MKTAKCEDCGTEFTVSQRTQKHCSKICKNRAWRAKMASVREEEKAIRLAGPQPIDPYYLRRGNTMMRPGSSFCAAEVL